MMPISLSQKIRLITILSLCIFVSVSFCSAQEQKEEELQTKYSAILGDFEFDLTEFGGEIIVLNFHIESGALWGDSGDGKPITLEPIEGEEFKFKSIDPDSGALEINFLKDEEDEYTVCHIVLLDQGVEITGNKIR